MRWCVRVIPTQEELQNSLEKWHLINSGTFVSSALFYIIFGFLFLKDFKWTREICHLTKPFIKPSHKIIPWQYKPEFFKNLLMCVSIMHIYIVDKTLTYNSNILYFINSKMQFKKFLIFPKSWCISHLQSDTYS